MRVMHKFVPYSLNIAGRLVTIHHPWIMGVVNVTPDSFYAHSRATGLAALESLVRQLVAEGADVIDVGACSTRPGAELVDEAEEMQRLRWALPVLSRVVPEHVLISVDTFRSRVAACCVEEFGAHIINDISGGTLDPDMDATMARLRVPSVVMHMRGTPTNMQQLTDYDNVTAEVLEWLARRIDELHQSGVNDVIADPGFGFAKTVVQNYRLLHDLELFHSLDVPLLVGMSRKSMVTRVLEVEAGEALNGTTVLNTAALLAGAHILRVHDVRAAVEARKLTELLINQDN
ncbi:MAG: dihydropteroate synthase [Muribaculaceae bacterium]|nr:dihydropteroate synthase [Muribaculaceae bacterium]